ncbi:hypothetical protein ACHAPD_003676 [Fusarium lateritium]
MTANLTEWHVNLPAINIVPEQPEYMISISTFFVKSRLTFLLLRFFDLLAQSSDDRDYIQQIEGLCAKIEDLIGEWSIMPTKKTLQTGGRSTTSRSRQAAP